MELEVAIRVFTLLPASITQRVDRVIVLNPSPAFQHDFRAFARAHDDADFRPLKMIITDSSALARFFDDISFLTPSTRVSFIGDTTWVN